MNKFILAVMVILVVGAGTYFIFTDGSENQNPQDQQPLVLENTITIRNFAFNPSIITIPKDSIVIWINEESALHRINSDFFNSEIINRGESFQFKFDNQGTYDYICGIHPSMKGQIIVQ